MAKDEDPKLFFARVDGLSNTLRTVGITKDEREITRIIIRSLSDDYDDEKRVFCSNAIPLVLKWR